MVKDFTDEEVKHVAWLCRINLEEEEIEDYKEKFNDILSYFKKVNEIDTENIEPTFQIIKDNNRFREDKVKESLSESEIFQNIPKKKDTFVKGPKIV